MEKCLYTITTDSQPIIDHYGPGLVLGCGFSGSGFKNSPAWGKMLSCLALGKEAEIPEGFQLNNYRLNRFNWNKNLNYLSNFCKELSMRPLSSILVLWSLDGTFIYFVIVVYTKKKS